MCEAETASLRQLDDKNHPGLISAGLNNYMPGPDKVNNRLTGESHQEIERRHNPGKPFERIELGIEKY